MANSSKYLYRLLFGGWQGCVTAGAMIIWWKAPMSIALFETKLLPNQNEVSQTRMWKSIIDQLWYKFIQRFFSPKALEARQRFQEKSRDWDAHLRRVDCVVRCCVLIWDAGQLAGEARLWVREERKIWAGRLGWCRLRSVGGGWWLDDSLACERTLYSPMWQPY